MNILHHKSWHVRNKNNIERVRRDEEKAAAEEKEKQRKIALAEQEARTDFLRHKARTKLQHQEAGAKDQTDAVVNGDQSKIADRYGTSGFASDMYAGRHINFFKEAEEGLLSTDSKNKEHEAEKKAEKEKWEKSVGILTYLGQSSSEASGSRPWYTEKKRKNDGDDDYEDQKRHEKKRKIQADLDPVHQMSKYLHKKKHKTDKEKHKKHKKHKHKEKEASKTVQSASSSKTIDQLRAERLRREREEKSKAVLLMAKVRGESVPSVQSGVTEVSDRDRKYNSQYNPDFVRRPKHR